uniref:Uncharacterized protein n=1 Tax=Opuntia streptacantha TaxID=393608 RepID=A0A7C8YV23_OPUST
MTQKVIAKASQNSWDTLTRTINARDEIHPGANPIKRSNNGELKTIFGTLRIYKPLNQLLCTCIRPSLFLNGAKDAGGGILFENIICRILTQGAILWKEATNGLPVHLASRKVNQTLVVLRTVLNHWQRIDEIAVNCVKRPRIVVSRSTDRRQINRQIRHLDEAFKARIMLDIDTVELNTLSPRKIGRFKKVLDLVIVNVDSEDLVRSFGHELLAKVRADESAGADHADSYRLYRISVEIYSVGRRHGCSVSVALSSSSLLCAAREME